MEKSRKCVMLRGRFIPNINRNLTPLGVLESKGYRFDSADGMLRVTKDSRIIMEAKRRNNFYSLRLALGVPVESGTCFKKMFECVINKYCIGCWDPLLIECVINKSCSGCWDPLLTLFY